MADTLGDDDMPSALSDPLLCPSMVDVYDHPVDEEPPLVPPPPRRRKLSSVKKTLGNLIVSIVGSGVLGLPYAFKQSGWVYSLICLLFMAMVSYYGMLLLVISRKHIEEERERRKGTGSFPCVVNETSESSETANMHNDIATAEVSSSSQQELMAQPHGIPSTSAQIHFSAASGILNPTDAPGMPGKEPPAKIESYGDLGFEVLGSGGRLLIDVCICLSQGGFCVAYLIFIGQNVSSVLRGSTALQPTIIAILAPFQMMLAWMKSLTRLAPFSIVADVANLAAFAVVIINGLKSARGLSEMTAFTGWQNAPIAFGVAAYAFEGVAMTLPLESATKKRSLFPTILGLGLLVIAALYSSVGMAGYIGYGEDTKEIVTLNLPNDWVTAAVKFAISFALFFTFPVMMLPVHEVNERRLSAIPFIQDRVVTSTPRRRIFFRGMRSLTVMVVAAVAMGVPRFSVFISLVGSSVCSILAFVLPAIIHLLVVGKEASLLYKAGDILLACFGLCLGCWGTYDSLCRFLGS